MQPTSRTKQLSPFQEAFKQHVPQRQGIGGAYRWRVFITTNEKNTSFTLNKLSSEPINGSAFLGVSGFFSLDLASVRGTKSKEALKYIVIVDLSVHVKIFWAEIEKIMEKVSTRDEFLNEFAQLPFQSPERFYPPCVTGTPFQMASAYIKDAVKDAAKGKNWLSDETRFKKIKNIFDKHHFVFVQGSFSDPELMDKIAVALSSQGILLDSIYLSNVREYIEENRCNQTEDIPKLRQSFQKLFPVVTDQTFLIDCEARPGGMRDESGRLIQRVTSAIRSIDIKKIIPYSPGTEQDLATARNLVNRAFPAGVPADPQLRMYWGAFVVYALIKARIFNIA